MKECHGGRGAKPKRATGDKGKRRNKRPEGDLGGGGGTEMKAGREGEYRIQAQGLLA